jgi:hypothetical protein
MVSVCYMLKDILPFKKALMRSYIFLLLTKSSVFKSTSHKFEYFRVKCLGNFNPVMPFHCPELIFLLLDLNVRLRLMLIAATVNKDSHRKKVISNPN